MPTSTVELQGEIMVSDFVKFRYFHKFSRRWYLALAELAFLLLTFLLTIAALIVSKKGEAPTNIIAPLLLFCLWSYLLFIRPCTAARQQLKTETYHCDLMSYAFTHDGFQAKGPNSSWELAWKVILGVYETKSLFLIYSGSSAATVLPKHLFHSIEEMAAWRSLVSAAIAPKKVKGPGLIGRFF